MDSEEYKSVIDGEYFTLSSMHILYNDNLDSDGTRDQLKARQILRKFLYDIINEADMLKQQEKENSSA
jgi:hypothetical protein